MTNLISLIPLVLLAVSTLFTGCGLGEDSNKKKGSTLYPDIYKEEDPKQYSYPCEFHTHSLLPPVPEGYEKEICPVNGVLLKDQEDAGFLDNCVRYTCEFTPETGTVELWRLLVKCKIPPSTGICKLGKWQFKHCFKFIDENGQKCSCEYGEIVCGM